MSTSLITKSALTAATRVAPLAPRAAAIAIPPLLRRGFASISSTPITSSTTRSHRIIVVGGGAAGLSISHQLLRSGQFSPSEIAVIDPATHHHYQPGWTLVGGGLKDPLSLRRDEASLINPKLKFYNTAVSTLSPDSNSVTLSNGDKLSYEHLVVVPGIEIVYDKIKGLPEALADGSSMVSTIYGANTVAKVFPTIERLKRGQAIFTQPAGVVKCAGAPQKVMWMALDHWKRAGLYNTSNPGEGAIKIAFATALPTMFGVPKYAARLEELRKERGVEGLFSHDLVEVNGDKAVFQHGEEKVTRQFDLLHVVPKMGPYKFVKDSAVADPAGFVEVNQATTQHVRYPNVWSAGDASSLPTSKTAAAITAQAPVLVENLLRTLEGKEVVGEYDGYTSCPLVTQYGKVMLAEFKYGGVPKETFGGLPVVGGALDQGTPRRMFYYLKKDFFPWVYYQAMVKGIWAGPKGWKF
ncbi:hypothetical protein B0T20DRAFT_137986 [Sordaria brevicollis]|uniref:FAD/NAD(P)-binding domain-containing protein n=1 Tax=Sordaria brevicollis TaxID=83679 RepID=A0AAE0PLY6_SORBR|nr:hypothetical protein B0T20DRAFT_137986 [Sordaria brevicollis]